MRDINSMSGGNHHPQSGQRSCNQRVRFLLCSLIRIKKGMGLRSAGLVPCCGQGGYRAQVPKHPI